MQARLRAGCGIGGDGGEQAEVSVGERMEDTSAPSDAPAGVDVVPGVGEGRKQVSRPRADDADGVVAPEIAGGDLRWDDPRACVFAADVQAAQAGDVVRR